MMAEVDRVPPTGPVRPHVAAISRPDPASRSLPAQPPGEGSWEAGQGSGRPARDARARVRSPAEAADEFREAECGTFDASA